MTTNKVEQASLRNYRRNAIGVGLATTAIMIGLLIYRLLLPPFNLISVLTLGGIALIGLFSTWLSYRGRSDLGMIILESFILFMMLFSVLSVAGIGLMVGALGFLLVTAVASVAISPKLMSRAVGVALITSLLVILLDFFGPERPQSETTATFNIITVVIVVLVYGLFIYYQFKNFSLRVKLIVAMTGVTIVAVFVITLSVSQVIRSALNREVGNNLHNLAESQALAIGELLSRQVNILETLALNDVVRQAARSHTESYQGTNEEKFAVVAARNEVWLANDGDEALVASVLDNDVSEELRRFSQTFPDHVQLILTDRYGAVIAATERPPQYDYRGEEWWEFAYVNGFGSVYITEPRFEEDRDAYVIDISVPVRVPRPAGGAEVAGVLRASFSLRQLEGLIATAETTSGQSIEILINESFELVIEDGRLELKAVNADEQVINTRFDELEEQLLLAEEGTEIDLFVIASVNETPSVLSRSTVNTLATERIIDKLGWKVLVFQDESTALSAVLEQSRAVTLLSIGVVIVSAFLAVLIAQLLSRPIVDLTDVALRVSEGNFSVQAPVRTNDEVGTLAATFNDMTSHINDLVENLEQRVANRTKSLQASIDVSYRLSTILDPEHLFLEVVEQVRSAFNYYHVHIYLLDEGSGVLRMAGGTGEAGQAMLAAEHKIEKGRGLVGRAAANNEIVLVPDVTQEPDWLPNQLLPDTKAEVAMPISIGNHIVGVLDVQHNIVNGLDEDSAALLQSVANQVAVAIQNARVYDQSQKQADRESLINEITQKIQTANTVESVLQIAAQELGQALGAQRTNIQLGKASQLRNGQKE